MSVSYQELLKPELIKTVSGLQLVSRAIASHHLSGFNKSKRVGNGMEFSQYRNYDPGDDPRLLDWKMLARSERYYIKQAEVKTNLTVKFVLDSSNSMHHTEAILSKIEYAKVLIATLAYIGNSQGDALGLFAINDKELYNVNPKKHKQHYKRFLQQLVTIQNQGKWPQNNSVTDHLFDRTHKELVFFVTDLYQHDEELFSFIKRLKTTKNEVVVLHLIGEKELKFDYNKTVTFQDLETGQKVKVDAQASKKEYLENLDDLMNTTKRILLSKRIGYYRFTLQQDFGEAIRLFLKERNRLI